jgi:chromatin accessibility complex protein 1
MGDIVSPTVSDVASPSHKGPTALVSSQHVGTFSLDQHRGYLRQEPWLKLLAGVSCRRRFRSAFVLNALAACCMQAISVNRVKNLLKDDPEIKSISTEACFAVAKATELFVAALVGRAAARMQAAGRDASLDYGDVAAVVAEAEPLDFLADVIPQTVKAAALLAKMS